MLLMGFWSVGGDGDGLALVFATMMTGHPVTFMEKLHDRWREPDLYLLLYKCVRNAIVDLVHLDVVVNVDAGFTPNGKLIGLCR